MHVGVVTLSGWSGIAMSTRTVADLLTAMGHQVTLWDHDADPAQPFDLLVFYEQFKPHWLTKARRKVLIPNQERFDPKLVPYLGDIDLVLAKSRHAEQVFAGLGARTRHVGFCSPDRHDPAVAKDFDKWVHVAGSSLYKGTFQIIHAWEANPDLPPLTVFWHVPLMRGRYPDLPHLRVIYDAVPEPEMTRIQNAFGSHLCTSVAEGWNHTLVEAMSTGALVITTDAPPMNEHVIPERGLLRKVAVAQSHHCGVATFVHPQEIARVVREAQALSDQEKRERGRRAREYTLALPARFEARFRECIEELIGVAIRET